MKTTLMHVVSCCALACATLIANFNCIFLIHQEKEPEVVRKLRRF